MNPSILRVFYFISLVTLPSEAFADQGSGYAYGNHPMMWGNMIMGPFMMLLMVGLLIFGLIIVLKFLGFGAGAQQLDRSLDILKERFAKGEIDQAEFESRKKTLNA